MIWTVVMVDPAGTHHCRKIKSPSLRGAVNYAEREFVGWLPVGVSLVISKPTLRLASSRSASSPTESPTFDRGPAA